jgi:hypothetical protein
MIYLVDNLSFLILICLSTFIGIYSSLNSYDYVSLSSYSMYRIPLNKNLLCIGLVATNSFSLCLSWKIFNSPLILNGNFVGYFNLVF